MTVTDKIGCLQGICHQFSGQVHARKLLGFVISWAFNNICCATESSDDSYQLKTDPYRVHIRDLLKALA